MFVSDEVVETCRKAAGADVELCAEEEVLEALVALQGARTALNVAEARLLSRAESEGITVASHGLTVGAWLARHARRPRRTTRAAATVARYAVGTFSLMIDAAIDGLVGWDHVELLCGVSNSRNRTHLSDVQEELVEAAGHLSFERWSALVRRVANQADADGGYDPNTDLHANRLRIEDLPDTTRELSARLVGETATTVTHTLETIADELFVQFARDAEKDPSIVVPNRRTLMALALHEACRRALATDLHGTRQPQTEAIIVIEPRRGEQPAARDSAGRAVPDGALGSLLADPRFTALLLDDGGNPLRYGRSRRLASPAQRIALAVRDGGCIFPGCDRPPGWCDAHHQPGWKHGGTTNTDAMALLCRRHHGITHSSGWSMHPDPDRAQRFLWRTPTGNTLHSQRHARRRTTPGVGAVDHQATSLGPWQAVRSNRWCRHTSTPSRRRWTLPQKAWTGWTARASRVT